MSSSTSFPTMGYLLLNDITWVRNRTQMNLMKLAFWLEICKEKWCIARLRTYSHLIQCISRKLSTSINPPAIWLFNRRVTAKSPKLRERPSLPCSGARPVIAQTPGQCEIEEKKIEEIIVGCSDRFNVLCNKISYKSCCANMCFLQGRYKPPKKRFDGPCR